MKKILTGLLFVLSIFTFSSLKEDKILSQKELLQKLNFSKESIYEKYNITYSLDNKNVRLFMIYNIEQNV